MPETANLIEQCICKIYDIPVEYLYSDNRRPKRNHAECGHFVWYVLHYHFGYSINQLSRKYGRSPRHIKKSISKIKFGIQTQPYYQKIYSDIQLYIINIMHS